MHIHTYLHDPMIALNYGTKTATRLTTMSITLLGELPKTMPTTERNMEEHPEEKNTAKQSKKDYPKGANMFTKGPWKVSEKRAKRFTIIRVVTDTLPAPHKIATMPRSDKVNRANARLIAAAPELWQACNDALFTIQNDSYAKSPEVIATLEDILNKALSKAKEE